MRTWFITGAARRVGASIVKRALKAGDSVVATVRNPAHVTAALDPHERLLVLPLDVAHELSARRAVAAALDRFGRIDVLVNHAGYGLLGAIEETSGAEVERVFRSNVFGLLNITRALLPQLRKQRSGQIVNIASVGARRAAAGWGIYCATKCAVEAISEALSDEGEPLGINTTLVEPGSFPADVSSPVTGVHTTQRIADCYETAGAVGLSHEPPPDPDELADAILELVDAPDPPRRLHLRSDVVRTVEARQDTVMRELEPWRSLVLPFDFAS